MVNAPRTLVDNAAFCAVLSAVKSSACKPADCVEVNAPKTLVDSAAFCAVLNAVKSSGSKPAAWAVVNASRTVVLTQPGIPMASVIKYATSGVANGMVATANRRPPEAYEELVIIPCGEDNYGLSESDCQSLFHTDCKTLLLRKGLVLAGTMCVGLNKLIN